MNISQTLDGVFIRGSLAKYLRGENVTPMSINDVQQSLEQFEADTGLNLHTGKLLKIEFGTSVILKEQTAQYLKLFGARPPMTRARYDKSGIETVNYSTRTGAFSFIAYDKTLETKTMPDRYKGRNVLRLEYKIKRHGIRAKFKRDLTPYDLCDKNVYSRLASLFVEFYNSIQKTGQYFTNFSTTLTPAKLKDLLAELYTQTNHDDYRTLISTLKGSGAINNNTLKRERARRRASNKMTDANPLIHELDCLVLDVVKQR
jgi:hypothetical protein